MPAEVVAVQSSPDHRFSKEPTGRIDLVAGMGVVGDAHFGATVRHRSRVRIDPTQPNLRQVHLMPAELLDECAAAGFAVQPGELGENVTTRGVEVHDLPTGTLIRLNTCLLAVTGLRNPCPQIEAFQSSLLGFVRRRQGERDVRRAGVMAVVVEGGHVEPGDSVLVQLPPGPHRALTVV